MDGWDFEGLVDPVFGKDGVGGEAAEVVDHPLYGRYDGGDVATQNRDY